MTEPRVVECHSAVAGPSAGASPALPLDILEGARQRLRIAALIWAGVGILVLVIQNALVPLLGVRGAFSDVFPWPGDLIVGGGVALSLVLFYFTRQEECDCEEALNLGLAYQVVLAFAIGLLNHWNPGTPMRGVSWIAVLILVHPTIVPSTTGKTLLAAVVAASMDPLGVAVAALRGLPTPPAATLLLMLMPNYIAAALAVVPARVISLLGRQVRKAREVGSYELGERLAAGGMGEVYRARHRMLARPAAIKLIRPELLGPSDPHTKSLLTSRFRREAEAASALHSPHSIALYDFGVTSDGAFYHVLELLDGLDLEALVKRFGPLPPERVVYLLHQVSHSLADAHASGLIHRDIKPANIYTCRMGQEVDFVKVLDFGLVKRADDGTDGGLHTGPDVVTGTPAYMAPELALGKRDLDPRVDIYALGCVAYRLLTGRLVFEAENARQMMYHHVSATPDPPSRRSELEIPPELDSLVLSCLEKDRDRRPATAEEFAARLAGIPQARPWTQERAARWWQLHFPAARPGPEAGWPGAGDVTSGAATARAT
ncbi:MAG: serine/threonine protein kinase [Gemmatimonadetes bacterium]|nr:serine/threonine protein kinase [Gemmatimonadota bacterium]